MSEGGKKEFLVFQRIATSVTTNIANSVVKPALRGNFAPLVKYTVANYLTGATMYAAFNLLFKDESPKSLGTEFDKALMYLWRAETAGIFGMILDNLPVKYNPYYNGASSGDLVRNFTPVIVRNLGSAFKNTTAALGGYKTPGSAVYDFSKETVVLLGQVDKFVKQRGLGGKSNDAREAKEVTNYKRQYEQDLGVHKRPIEYEGSKNQPYYRNLRSAILWGDEKSIAENYFHAVNYLEAYYSKDKGLTQVGALEKAHQSVMSSIMSMNPTYSTQTKDRTSTKRKQFLDWIRKRDIKGYQKTIRVEKRYLKNLGLIKKIRLDDEYTLKYSSTPDLNYRFIKGKGRHERYKPYSRDELYKYDRSSYYLRRAKRFQGIYEEELP